MKTTRGRLVVTAAHCLPYLPPAHAASYVSERTYKNLIGPLSSNDPLLLWAECWFVDPVADLAVLREPDSQALSDEWAAYDEFVEPRPTLRIGIPANESVAWLLTRDAQWQRCAIRGGWSGRSLALPDASEAAIAPGTSGSPIISDDGAAIGVISCGRNMNPVLAYDLPVRVLSEFGYELKFSGSDPQGLAS